MRITKREFLKKLGLGGAAGAGLCAFGDASTVGDPDNPWFGKHINNINHTMVDGPSSTFMNGKIIQPAREIPVFSEVDVAVVGGGPAGFAAAVAAARTGAKTALIERYGSLGGLFTNGMVLIILSTCERGSDGKGRLVTRGICEEFMKRAEAMGPGAITPHARPGANWQPTMDAEAGKVLMDRMAAEANVQTFFHSWGVDVIQVGNVVKGVVFESKQGRQAVLAKQVVDATGDGDVFFQAGADYRQITHSLGFVYRIGNMDRVSPPDGKFIKGFPARGNEPQKTAFWKNMLGPKGNGLDVRELSAAEVAHREAAWKFVEKMKKNPGYDKAFLMNTCSQLGVRATRLMDAEVILDRAGALACKTYTDTVAVCGDDAFTRPAFQVPLRALIPKGVDNVLAAGRCIGCTPDLIDRVRLIAPCFVTGQAAGTAAAMAARTGCTPRQLDITALRRRLEADNMCLA